MPADMAGLAAGGLATVLVASLSSLAQPKFALAQRSKVKVKVKAVNVMVHGTDQTIVATLSKAPLVIAELTQRSRTSRTPGRRRARYLYRAASLSVHPQRQRR